MTFAPKVGDAIRIQRQNYAFTGVPTAPTVVYAEPGRKANVYRLLNSATKEEAALKVFFPGAKNQLKATLFGTTEKIVEAVRREFPDQAKHGSSGLAVARRHIITDQTEPDIVRRHPEIEYSILMPWIQGASWASYVMDRHAMLPGDCLQLATSFAKVIAGLEQRRLAHCDLSSDNLMFKGLDQVELVDIEDIYAPGFHSPQPMPTGTGGYVPEWVMKSGLWGETADRIAGAVLICEILCWRFEDVRRERLEKSFFAPGEMGRNTRRFKLMREKLGEIIPTLVPLFERAWRASTVTDCAPLSEWYKALQRRLLEQQTQPACPHCQRPVQASWKTCPYCAGKLGDEDITSGAGQGSTSRGWLPILQLNPHKLGFTLNGSTPFNATLQISNSGTGRLKGKISHANGLRVSATTFDLGPGQSTDILATLDSYDAIEDGDSCLLPRALIIDSNCGVKVISAEYHKPKRGLRRLFNL